MDENNKTPVVESEDQGSAIDADASPQAAVKTSLLQKLKTDKKLMIGAILVALVVIGAVAMLLTSSSDDLDESGQAAESESVESSDSETLQTGGIQNADDIRQTIEQINEARQADTDALNQLDGLAE